jgi:multidrug efflux system membrane fusion protein
LTSFFIDIENENNMTDHQKSATSVRALPAVFSLTALTVLAATLAGCGKPAAQEAPPAGGPPITAAIVLEKSVAETQEFTGRLEAIERVEIRPRVAGFITSVHFKPGAEVKKGKVLFVIDPRPYQAEASRAEAAALSAHAKADLAKIEFSRAEKLVAEKAISQGEADQKSASLKELDAGARAAQASYAATKLNLSFTEVRSPIDGRVSKAEITLGNLVDGNTLLTSVVSDKSIYASFNGDEDTYLRLGHAARKGAPIPVRIGLANETGYPHEGKLEFIDNRVDPATGSVRMRAIFNNTDNKLAPGLFARVQLGGLNSAAKSTVVAERAIGTDQNRKFVFVVNAENKAEYRPVTLGPIVDGLRVVHGGVKPGEKIVVNGLQRVRPGAPVTAQMVDMDADPNAPQAGATKTNAKPATGSAS